MSRGCAVTVYLGSDSTKDPRTHWSIYFSRSAIELPFRVEGNNGGDLDVDVDFVQYWNNSNSRVRSHSVKAYNPWIGKPYISIDDKEYYLSEGDSEKHWDNQWHDSTRGQHVYYTVKRLNDSDDYKEYELIIYD